MKDLGAVEPRIVINSTNTPGDATSSFIISASGSYYLAGNLMGEPAKRGIFIAASGVTVDLMGFSMIGTPGSLEAIGVSGAGAPGSLIIRNGSIHDWGSFGIATNVTEGVMIEGIIVRNNGNHGILCSSHCVVRNCFAVGNGSNGITTSFYGVVEGCTSNDNVIGISVASGSAVRNCTVQGNSGDGVNCSGDCTVSSSTARNNGGIGIDTASNSTIRDCQAYSNTSDGIQADSNSSVVNCKSNFNGLDGIQIGGDSLVLKCTVDDNGQAAGNAGIRVTSGSTRVEGNTVTDNNTTGIDLDAGGNLVIGNWFNGNTSNIVTTGTNLVGPTLTSANIGTATNPFANFEF
jgi:parallel beta-helix repeat protein